MAIDVIGLDFAYKAQQEQRIIFRVPRRAFHRAVFTHSWALPVPAKPRSSAFSPAN